MTSPAPSSTRAALFADRNFRWLFGGAAVSLLGDQFTLVALPWLVLKLTGDPLALGGVLAVQYLPRAVFILMGGALVDRHSPKRVLALTKWVNAGLLGLLALLVATGTLSPWMVYAMALATGLASAFGYPAGTSILPQALPSELLEAGNGFMMGLGQLTVLLGPVVAGAWIALFSGPGSALLGRGIADGRGLGAAFAADALSFAVSAWTLGRLRVAPLRSEPVESGVTTAIGEALRHFWKDRPLRLLCLYYAGIAFCVEGPVRVALPLLAHRQLAGGAAALGLLMAAYGGGILVGTGAYGLRPDLRLGTLGTMVLLADGLIGLAFLPLGGIRAPWQGMLLLAPVGLLDGLVQVPVFTWIQRRMPPRMLGRSMSLFMFIFMVLSPLSAALTGALLRSLSLRSLFAGSGLLLLALVLAGFAGTSLRDLEDPAEGLEEAPT